MIHGEVDGFSFVLICLGCGEALWNFQGWKLSPPHCRSTSGPITSWEVDGETVETVSDFIFFELQNHCRW